MKIDISNAAPEMDLRVAKPVREFSIPQIQGAALASDMAGLRVKTHGVVTAVMDTGFVIQDPEGDNDPKTSDAVFVYVGKPDGGDGAAVSGGATKVRVGDAVEVTGQVTEFAPGKGKFSQPVTELGGGVTVAVTAHGQPLPEPALIGQGGRMPPDKDMIEGQRFLSSLEWMRVRLDKAVVVGPTNKYGEAVVLADDGAGASGRNERGGLTVSEGDNNPERIEVALGHKGDTVPAPQLNVGDHVGSIVGILQQQFGRWEVLPTDKPQGITKGNLKPQVANLVGTPTQMTVASFNVDNFSPEAGERVTAVGKAIVENLRAPDIIGLQEIQDNDGPKNSGNTDASKTYQGLIAAIKAAGGPDYAWVDLPPENNADGGEPGGNIRPGFLYRTDRVEYVDGSKARIGASNPAFAGSRKSLLCQFRFGGQEVTVVNNHFASKMGSTDEFGLIQPLVNGGETQRTAQAQVVGSYVKDILDKDPQTNVVVLGDCNEDTFNKPIKVLKGFGLMPLDEQLKPYERFSYNYGGNSQAIDHMFVPTRLLDAAEFQYVHIDSEFADSGRVSDHDPAVLRLTLAKAGK